MIYFCIQVDEEVLFGAVCELGLQFPTPPLGEMTHHASFMLVWDPSVPFDGGSSPGDLQNGIVQNDEVLEPPGRVEAVTFPEQAK